MSWFNESVRDWMNARGTTSEEKARAILRDSGLYALQQKKTLPYDREITEGWGVTLEKSWGIDAYRRLVAKVLGRKDAIQVSFTVSLGGDGIHETRWAFVYIVPSSCHLSEIDFSEWFAWLEGDRGEPWETGRPYLYLTEGHNALDRVKGRLPRRERKELERRAREYEKEIQRERQEFARALDDDLRRLRT